MTVLTEIQREGLRRISRAHDWREAYQLDVAPITLARLQDKGLVESKSPNGLRASRYRITDAGRVALLSV